METSIINAYTHSRDVHHRFPEDGPILRLEKQQTTSGYPEDLFKVHPTCGYRYHPDDPNDSKK